MYAWLKKYLDPVIPLYAVLPLIICFGFNTVVYSGTMILCKDRYHYDFTTPFDRMVPVSSWWMYIYFGCYLFWIINYIMVGHINREDRIAFYRFVTTDLMSRIVCAFFYIFLPTTNVRPEVVGTHLSDRLLAFLYQIDQPANLFPSIHCLVSWLCFIGIRKSDKVPLWYKIFSCVFAVLVMASTQFTKQHYIVDVISALILAEGLNWLNQTFDLYSLSIRLFSGMTEGVRNFICMLDKKGDYRVK